MEASENDRVGIKASHPRKAMGSIIQLNCIYSNASCMATKQEELEVIVQQENYNTVARIKTWWDDFHNWSAAMDFYEPFRRDKQKKRGSGIVLTGTSFYDDAPPINSREPTSSICHDGNEPDESP
ncbi:rna-directed dna polymerase from mobile element jockey-like [Pitangus sulphuratus]|nr:rna-directed dna polymerase from mobile element jockey-like [Pitangus sulphuratus]